MDQNTTFFTVFLDQKMLIRGNLSASVLAAAKAKMDDNHSRVVIYNDSSGKPIDVELQGSTEDIIKNIEGNPALHQYMIHPEKQAKKPKKRGRPKLGVTSKEISLLPRHWQWLARQKGSPSATLRRLIDESRKANMGRELVEQSRDAVHAFMWDMCGNFVNFEEATRYLFRNDFVTFYEKISTWPNDIKEHVRRLVEIYRSNLEKFHYSFA